MEAVTITNLMESVNEVVTNAIGWLEEFGSAIVQSPLLMLFVVGIPLVGLGVGLLNRLIRV